MAERENTVVSAAHSCRQWPWADERRAKVGDPWRRAAFPQVGGWEMVLPLAFPCPGLPFCTAPALQQQQSQRMPCETEAGVITSKPYKRLASGRKRLFLSPNSTQWLCHSCLALGGCRKAAPVQLLQWVLETPVCLRHPCCYPTTKNRLAGAAVNACAIPIWERGRTQELINSQSTLHRADPYHASLIFEVLCSH